MNFTTIKDQMRFRLAELIDKRNALREQTENTTTSFEYAKLTGQIIGLYEALIMVQEMEIEEFVDKVDVQEARHGHWIELINSSYSPFDGTSEYIYICSECGRKEDKRETYCHCGAKMDGGENDVR